MIRQEAVTVLRLDNTQHNTAAGQAAQAIGQVGKAGEVSAGQVKAAMRSLPAQFTDVATQLAGGQNPLLVLLQQGGQVRDQFGSIGAAVRGIGSLLTPATLGVAGVAALVGVLAAADRDATKFRNTLALSGNAAGLTESRFEAMAASISDATRTTVGGAKDIVLALAEAGTVGGGALESVAKAAARVAEVSGRSGEDVAKDFARMAGGVADWAAEHNKAWNFITAEQYKYIKQLEQQGRAEEAMLFVSKQITGQIETQTQNLGFLESAWAGVAKMASSAWQAMLGLGKADTVAQQLAAAQGDLARVEQRLTDAGLSPVKTAGVGLLERERDALRQRIADLGELQRMEARGADAAAARAAKNRADIAAARTSAKGGAADRTYLSKGFVGPPTLEEMFPSVLGAVDPFGDFVRGERGGTDAVNQALAERNTQRLRLQADLLTGLTDANEKANLELIADDQARALAQVDLERRRIQRQIEAVYGSTPDRVAAESAADEAAALQRQAVATKFAKDTALVTREQVRDALANAFRDTKDPLQAFGDAIGNIIFQRVSVGLADALVGVLLGPEGGSGGLFGAGLAALGGLFGGPKAGGGSVSPGTTYLVGERGPELLSMGAQGGRITPNHAIGGPTVVINQTNHIGEGVSRAGVEAAMAFTKEATKAEVMQALRRERMT